MKNKKMIALMWGFALLPAVMVFLSMPFLPEEIPTSWDFDGHVSYGGKNTLWLMVGLSVLIALLYQFLPRIDPKRENYQRFQSYYDAFGVIIPLFMALMIAIILIETFRPGALNVGRVVTALVSALFMVIGCIVGKVKSNWFMGFRTPWALADPDVWNKTQRLGGWVFFLSGLVSLPLSLLAPEKVTFIVFFTLLMGGIVLTFVMSYLWFRAGKGE